MALEGFAAAEQVVICGVANDEAQSGHRRPKRVAVQSIALARATRMTPDLNFPPRLWVRRYREGFRCTFVTFL